MVDRQSGRRWLFAAMAGLFAACVIVVAAAVRVLENALAKRRGEPPA